MSGTVEEPLSKYAVIIAGPNGAGKTTFVSEYLPVSGAEYISADAIAGTLVSTPNEFDRIRIRAGRLFLKRIQCLIQEEANLIIEVTLAGRGFRRIIPQLKNTGYSVAIVFLYLRSPEVCIARVRNRVMAGGHDVPEEDIIRRFYRSKRNFWRFYKDLVDEWGLFYNSGDSIQQVAAGESNRFTVTNTELFELFRDDINSGGVECVKTN